MFHRCTLCSRPDCWAALPVRGLRSHSRQCSRRLDEFRVARVFKIKAARLGHRKDALCRVDTWSAAGKLPFRSSTPEATSALLSSPSPLTSIIRNTAPNMLRWERTACMFSQTACPEFCTFFSPSLRQESVVRIHVSMRGHHPTHRHDQDKNVPKVGGQ